MASSRSSRATVSPLLGDGKMRERDQGGAEKKGISVPRCDHNRRNGQFEAPTPRPPAEIVADDRWCSRGVGRHPLTSTDRSSNGAEVRGLAPEVGAIDPPGLVGIQTHEVGFRHSLAALPPGGIEQPRQLPLDNRRAPEELRLGEAGYPCCTSSSEDRQQGLGPMPPGSGLRERAPLAVLVHGRAVPTRWRRSRGFSRPSTIASRDRASAPAAAQACRRCWPMITDRREDSARRLGRGGHLQLMLRYRAPAQRDRLDRPAVEIADEVRPGHGRPRRGGCSSARCIIDLDERRHVLEGASCVFHRRASPVTAASPTASAPRRDGRSAHRTPWRSRARGAAHRCSPMAWSASVAAARDRPRSTTISLAPLPSRQGGQRAI